MTATAATLARPGATIGYRREGTGPPLLLLHATLSSAVQLAPLASRLATRFTVISVDRRGSGASQFDAGHLDAPIDVAVHVDDLVALLAAKHIDACHLLGHSYGGCVALELAARRPQLVGGVFAWEPPYAPLAPVEERARLARLATETLEAAQAGDPAAAADVFLAGVSGPGSVAALASISPRRRRALGSVAVAEAPLLGLEPDGLSGIACPVTIATGTRSGPFYPAVARALIERIPGARHLDVPDADHVAPVDAPDIIAAAVETLLDR